MEQHLNLNAMHEANPVSNKNHRVLLTKGNYGYIIKHRLDLSTNSNYLYIFVTLSLPINDSIQCQTTHSGLGSS